jgi:hypothetical protein
MSQPSEDKPAKQTPLDTVSPIGREEAKSNIAAEIKGDDEVPKKINPKGEEPDATPPVEQNQNPKHPGSPEAPPKGSA